MYSYRRIVAFVAQDLDAHEDERENANAAAHKTTDDQQDRGDEFIEKLIVVHSLPL